LTDLFDQNSNPPPNNVAPPINGDPFADKLKTIVNDQGEPKYKDTQAALDALKASQDHIKRLEDEAKAKQSLLDNAAAEKARADALEEIVQRFSNSPPPSKVETPTKEVDETAIVKTLETLLNQRDAKTVAQNNVQAVTSALVAKFGDEAKTKEAVAAKAAELGMTPQRLGALSSENPKAVLAWFGVDAKVASPQPTTPSQTPLNPPKPSTGVEMPSFSLISGRGATDKNRKELMAKIKEDTYKRLGVEL
jgi:hypothetical protein